MEKDHDLLIRIDENVQGIQERLDKGEHRFFRIEKRVSNLERWRAYLTGAWAVLIVLIAIFWDWVKGKTI